jgi:GTPase SAR1 family protein
MHWIPSIFQREISVHIFDTSGNGIFQDIRNEFYLEAHGILLVNYCSHFIL